jgi:preprotein translocase subunit YajC
MFPVHVLALFSIHTMTAFTGPILAKTASTKSNGSFTLIFFVLLFGVGYMFLIRPQRQRRQRQLQLGREIAVGDRVVLSSGIFGRVEGFVGDNARIEIAPGIVIEVVRAAVSRRVDQGVDGGDHSGDAHFDERDHDGLVDDADNDPYSVAPLEAGETPDPRDDADGAHPGGNGSGGGNR